MLILVCVDHRAKMLPLLEKKKRFGVSVLKAEQAAFSEYFARGKHSAEAEARLGIHFREILGETFVIDDTLVQLACKLVAQHVAGDHVIFVAEVETALLQEGEPLLYFGGAYRKIAASS